MRLLPVHRDFGFITDLITYRKYFNLQTSFTLPSNKTIVFIHETSE